MNEPWTPGPWVIQNFPPRDITLKRVHWGVGPQAPLKGVALVFGDTDANARLIAASPTLYEYVAKKALEGDADAARIISLI